jgi:uncharacterized RDD family membrane protein YckC
VGNRLCEWQSSITDYFGETDFLLCNAYRAIYEMAAENRSAGNTFTMQRLQTKVALVTGASMGFGAAIARRFGLEGAAIIVNYPVNESEAERVVFDILAAGGRAISIRADVTK